MIDISISSVKSYNIQIYAGFKNTLTGDVKTIKDANRICQEWCDRIGQCVTVTPTNYIYTKGGEPGVIVGFIHYPRFPSSFDLLKAQAIELASELLVGLEQVNVSIAFPDDTIMLTNPIGKQALNSRN